MGVFKVSIFTPRQVEVLRVSKVHKKGASTSGKRTPPTGRKVSNAGDGPDAFNSDPAFNEPTFLGGDDMGDGVADTGVELKSVMSPDNRENSHDGDDGAAIPVVVQPRPSDSGAGDSISKLKKDDLDKLSSSGSSTSSGKTGVDSNHTSDFEAVDVDVDMETVSKVRKGNEGKDETFEVTYKVKKFVKNDQKQGEKLQTPTTSPQVPPNSPQTSTFRSGSLTTNDSATIRSDNTVTSNGERPSMSGDAFKKYQEEKRKKMEQAKIAGNSTPGTATPGTATPPSGGASPETSLATFNTAVGGHHSMGVTAPWQDPETEMPPTPGKHPQAEGPPPIELPSAVPSDDEDEEEEEEVLDVIDVEEELRLLLLDNIPGVRTIWNRCNSLRNVGENIDENQVSFLEVTFYAKRKTAMTMAQKVLTEIGIGKDYGYIAVTECDFFRPIIDNSSRALQEDETDEDGDEEGGGGGGGAETVQTKEKKKRKKAFNDLNAQIEFDSVLAGVKDQAALNFDFVAFLIIAAIIAALGLATNSTVSVVASMLVSPMMGPILATVMGTILFLNGNTTKAVHKTARSLLLNGFKVEFFCLGVCVIVGFIVGLGFWGSDDLYEWGQFGTSEMVSRTSATGLLIGMLIALPSGGGVALSLLGNNGSGLVGVAISASLLPPAVNCGLYFAFALRNGNASDSVKKGLISFALTAVNVCAIYIAALVTFYIKRANPLGDMEGRSMETLFGVENFDEVAATAGAVSSQSASVLSEDTGATGPINHHHKDAPEEVSHAHVHQWSTTQTPSPRRRGMRPAHTVYHAMDTAATNPMGTSIRHERFGSHIPHAHSREAWFNYRMNNDIPSSDDELADPSFAPFLSSVESRHRPSPPLSISQRNKRPKHAAHTRSQST